MALEYTTEDLIRDTNAMVQSEWAARKYFANTRQRRAAKLLGTGRKALEGLGRVRMEVDTEVYHYYGQLYGYACWKDEGFLRWMEQHHPELKVQCKGTKDVQVGYGGLTAGATKKFHKTYPAANANN